MSQAAAPAQPAQAADEGAREADAALLALLAQLRGTGYRFITPTPATHARVVARPTRQRGRTLTDALGWNLPFPREAVPPAVFALLERAAVLRPAGEGLWKSTLRVSTLHDALFLHSAFPTDEQDAVFLGPDSYRFADLIAAELATCTHGPETRIVDIGTGAGVGAVVAARCCPDSAVMMTDVNTQALHLACLNTQAAGVEARAMRGSKLAGLEGPVDIALANPPYIIDEDGRAYRDGGGMHGGEVALDMARAAVAQLAPGGRLILYTGAAIVDGGDALRDALAALAAESGCRLRYREIDPDVFGEELENHAYRDVDRIALVAAIVTRAG